MEKNKYQTEGEQFLRQWYEAIDNKRPFKEISANTAGEDLAVDFPGNPLDFKGFQCWYEEQCQNFTGKHEIHRIQVKGNDRQMEIFSEITWRAENTEGEPITLFPNVTLKLCRKEKWAVYFYGCTDREPPHMHGKE